MNSRPATADEVFALKWEHNIIDDDLLRSLGLFRTRRRDYVAHVVRGLYVIGFDVQWIEDWAGLTTRETKRITRPVRATACRFLRLAGLSASAIAKRLGLGAKTVGLLSDIPNTYRTPRAKLDAIRAKWAAGACRGGLAHEFGVSRSVVTWAVAGAPRGPHGRCWFCTPGRKRPGTRGNSTGTGSTVPEFQNALAQLPQLNGRNSPVDV